MLDKLQDLKRKSEESNERLTKMNISEESDNQEVQIVMNGHRVLTEIHLSESFRSMNQADQEDLLYQVFNKSLQRVNKINEEEVMSSAKDLFPGF